MPVPMMARPPGRIRNQKWYIAYQIQSDKAHDIIEANACVLLSLGGHPISRFHSRVPTARGHTLKKCMCNS